MEIILQTRLGRSSWPLGIAQWKPSVRSLHQVLSATCYCTTGLLSPGQFWGNQTFVNNLPGCEEVQRIMWRVLGNSQGLTKACLSPHYHRSCCLLCSWTRCLVAYCGYWCPKKFSSPAAGTAQGSQLIQPVFQLIDWFITTVSTKYRLEAYCMWWPGHLSLLALICKKGKEKTRIKPWEELWQGTCKCWGHVYSTPCAKLGVSCVLPHLRLTETLWGRV